MQFDEDFSPSEEDPGFPDKLLDRTMKHLPVLSRVDVEFKRAKTWKKINGFTVDVAPNGSCDEDPENICRAVMMIAVTHAEDNDLENPQYRAKFWVRDKKGATQRKTFQFKYDTNDEEAEPALDQIEQQEVLAVAFDRAITLINLQTSHIQSQNERIMEQSTLAGNQTAPLLSTIDTLVSKFHEGLTMQATALQALYDIDKNAKELELKAQNNKYLMDLLSMAAPKALDQFGAYLDRKKGVDSDGKKITTEADDESEADTEEAEKPKKERKVKKTSKPSPVFSPVFIADFDQPSETISSTVTSQDVIQSDPGKQKITTDEESDPGKIETEKNKEEPQPFAAFVQAFGKSITVGQWKELAEPLGEEQLENLKLAVRSADDGEAAVRVIEFKDSLRPSQFLGLQSVLDEEQKKVIEKLLEMISTIEDEM